MTLADHSAACLRFFGDDLEPGEITRLLGADPDRSERRGDERVGKSGHVYVAKRGNWRLRATRREPEALEEQVTELLGRLTQDLSVWAALGARFEIDLFCGIFMGTGNDELVLSPQTLAALGARGIQLHLDIYDASED